MNAGEEVEKPKNAGQLLVKDDEDAREVALLSSGDPERST